ncbi:hypothetical protein KR059_004410, partial [Drosophila kikkawai]
PYTIYNLKKRPVEGHVEIQPEPIEATNSLESEEVEEEQSARDDDFPDDSVLSEGETYDLSLIKLKSDSDRNIKVRFGLLNGIRNIPEWDELSATTTVAGSPAEAGSLMGEFRDPLDATSSVFPIEDTSLKADHEDLELSSLEDPKSSCRTDSQAPIPDMSSDSELESHDEADQWQVVRQPRQVRVDPIQDFIKVKPVESYIETPCEQHRRDLLSSQNIQIYLYELVDQVVERIEAAEYQLRKNLDKHKLLERLCALVEEDFSERSKNNYLINLLTGHHLRRFKYSLITPEPNSSMNEGNWLRCQNALNKLDCQMKKEQEAKEIYVTERDRLQAELVKKQSQDEKEIKRMEDLIQETLLPHTPVPERLELVLDHVFRQMRKKRNEISVTRLSLIKVQHINSYVMKKLEETETIAEGLTLHTYEAATVQVNSLASSVSAKTAELERLYTLFCNKIHTISHLRCRRKLLSRTVRVAKNELFQLRKTHSDLRAKVYQSHVKHNQLLAQIREVRYKGGLMNYPLLLMDFDKTDKLVTDKRERVSLLRAHHDILLEKIEEIESTIQRS